MSELQQAIGIATSVLDRPHTDPDGDECVVARQFLRAVERMTDVLTEAHDWRYRTSFDHRDDARVLEALRKLDLFMSRAT